MRRFLALFVAMGFLFSCEQATGSQSALPDIPGAPRLIPGTTRLTASWTAASGAESYEVWTSETDKLPDAVLTMEVTGAFAVIMDLQNDKPYWVWVRAKNSAGASGFSNPARGTPEQYKE